MNIKNASLLFSSFFKTIGYLFLFIVFGLFLDSTYMHALIPYAQHVATASMLIGFAVVYYRPASRLREQMLYAVLIGYVGEYLFSIVLGMYTYRLGNVPHYVPLGHAIVLIAAIYFCKEAIVKTCRKLLEKIFTIFILIYATLFLIFAGDVFGFVMSLLVIFLLRNKPRERLFYLSMYVVVAFVEIIGTTYQCWSWPETAWGVIPFLKSANPPSGISLFYFLLDLGSLWLYKKRHKVAWARMKNLRKLRERVGVL
ncbi:MAG: hypothetical protein ACI9SI_000124 [Polaribacter sp.]|jgi:hypothetical protein